MDLLTLLFRLPILPVQGFIRLARIIQAEAEAEMHDPMRVRHELEEAEREAQHGAISEEELRRVEYDAVARMGGLRPPSAGDGPPSAPAEGS